MRALFFCVRPQPWWKANPGGKPTLVGADFCGSRPCRRSRGSGPVSSAWLGFALALGCASRAVGRHPRRSGSTVARERVPLARPCSMAGAPSRPSRRAGFSIRLLPQRKRPAVQAGPLRAFSPGAPRFHKSRRGWRPTALPGTEGSCGPSNARNLGASRSVGIPLMRVGSGLARDSPPSVERVRRCIASERAVTSLARSPRGLLRHRRD
jgi:hypothetical protein